MKCCSCSNELRHYKLNTYDYCHCLNCKLEYLLELNSGSLNKMIFKFKDGDKHISVHWAFKVNQTHIVVDWNEQSNTLTIDHIISVKFLEDIPNKIKTYLLFS